MPLPLWISGLPGFTSNGHSPRPHRQSFCPAPLLTGLQVRQSSTRIHLLVYQQVPPDPCLPLLTVTKTTEPYALIPVLKIFCRACCWFSAAAPDSHSSHSSCLKSCYQVHATLLQLRLSLDTGSTLCSGCTTLTVIHMVLYSCNVIESIRQKLPLSLRLLVPLVISASLCIYIYICK